MQRFSAMVAVGFGAMMQPAFASTIYQAGVFDTSCNGKQSCRLALPAVAAGETLTIGHVSCAIETSGEQGGVTGIVLSSLKAKLGQRDLLTPGLTTDGPNFLATVNLQTLFYVIAGDQPAITITGTSNIIGNAGGGCFVSGTESP